MQGSPLEVSLCFQEIFSLSEGGYGDAQGLGRILIGVSFQVPQGYLPCID